MASSAATTPSSADEAVPSVSQRNDKIINYVDDDNPTKRTGNSKLTFIKMIRPNDVLYVDPAKKIFRDTNILETPELHNENSGDRHEDLVGDLDYLQTKLGNETPQVLNDLTDKFNKTLDNSKKAGKDNLSNINLIFKSNNDPQATSK